MKRLYTPFKVNKLELKNRVIMSPMSIGHTVDGFIMDDVVEFYKRRAQGGVGLIIFANMQWDKLRYNPNHGAMLTDEKYIPSLKKLTDAIHEGGSKVFAQLMHRGRCANRASIQGEQAVAPSPIPGRFTHFEMPKELTVEEIKEFVDWQAEAAVIAKKAGFDGIEIETNSGYLYGQFFSPLTNHRTDEYGGSLENRCRFMVETLEGMRAAVGPDYPISLRVSGSDFMDGGCNGDDIAEICELLDKTGYVDGFSITAGWHESAVPLITMEVPHGAWAYLGRQIKARVKAPVAQGMRMNIEKAEELVDRGDFDAIVMGRPFLADPDVVNKAEAGKASTIRPCVGCNAKCLDMAMASKPIGCIGNYECNREEELEDENGLMPTEKKSEHPEKILVIGAGPSGMEFARVAALRGHKVTIWEKRNRTIGLSLYAPTWAIYAYRRWFLKAGARKEKLTAQIVCLCILGHHSGLTDCLNEMGQSPFLKSMMQNEDKLRYNEAAAWYVENVVPPEQLDELFHAACNEISACVKRIGGQTDAASVRMFELGMLARMLLSILIDADRWDSACFDYNADPFQEKNAPDWARAEETFERFR